MWPWGDPQRPPESLPSCTPLPCPKGASGPAVEHRTLAKLYPVRVGQSLADDRGFQDVAEFSKFS